MYNLKLSSKKGFTLIELLVVIAIIAILAAILFPVLAQARGAAKKTVDISGMRQMTMAHTMYSSDFDGGMPMSNSGGDANLVQNCFGCQPPDTVPGMQLMPYVKNEDVFYSAADPNALDKKKLVKEHSAEVGWNFNTITPQQRLYALMVRSNIGYNYVFFSPWRLIPGTIARPTQITSASVNETEVTSPSSTIMWGSSIWYRNLVTGAPEGAGNWVIEAPCARDSLGAALRPASQYMTGTGDGTFRRYNDGWNLDQPGTWLVYGGLWPWHNQSKLNVTNGHNLKDGHVIIGMADGSVKSWPVRRTALGCRASGSLEGRLNDASAYMWDLD